MTDVVFFGGGHFGERPVHWILDRHEDRIVAEACSTSFRQSNDAANFASEEMLFADGIDVGNDRCEVRPASRYADRIRSLPAAEK